MRLRPDVIFAYDGDVAPYAKKATGSIPIVAMVSKDPVLSGLVASIGRPGANVTGITLIYDHLAGKVTSGPCQRLERIAEAAPTYQPGLQCENPRLLALANAAGQNAKARPH